MAVDPVVELGLIHSFLLCLERQSTMFLPWMCPKWVGPSIGRPLLFRNRPLGGGPGNSLGALDCGAHSTASALRDRRFGRPRSRLRRSAARFEDCRRSPDMTDSRRRRRRRIYALIPVWRRKIPARVNARHCRRKCQKFCNDQVNLFCSNVLARSLFSNQSLFLRIFSS